jgi:hypothetical protein
MTASEHSGSQASSRSDACGSERVVGVRVMDHLDGLPVSKRRQVGAQGRPLAALGRRPRDHDHLVARAEDIDKFANTSPAERLSHELQRLLAVVAGGGRGSVAAMPLNVGIEKVADHVEVPAKGGLIAATG